MSVSEWLVAWFAEHGTVAVQDVRAGWQDNYLDRGWIDSFQFIRLINDIESRFDVRFANDEFEDRSFATPGGLVRIVEAKLERRV